MRVVGIGQSVESLVARRSRYGHRSVVTHVDETLRDIEKRVRCVRLQGRQAFFFESKWFDGS